MTYLPKAPRIRRLQTVPGGRNFACGDIHGAYNTVLAAMKEADFDGQLDRIFPVGDLIDRGEDSWRCARFSRLPYVEPIAGNHEDMLLELYKDGPPDEAVLQWAARHNGFGWWLSVSEEMRYEILVEIAKLPTIIELETPRGLVGFVHADIPAGMDWQTFTREVEAENPEVLHTALWGRDRIQGNNHDGVKGIGRVFVGHTPQWNGIQRLANVYACDTGAIFGETGMKAEGRLTFAEAMCQTTVLTEPRAQILVDVRLDPTELPPGGRPYRPFGNYARG